MVKEKIISLLKNTPDYFSGEDLSRELGISRAAVWKNIQELRRQGYRIEAATNVGYRLAAVPDRLLASEIQAGLKTKMIGRTIFCHETLGSTMEEAFLLANNGAIEGTVVCAESQTKGRGRMGRNWVSPKGKGIYFSVILRPRLPVTEVAKMTLLAAVAVCDALRKVSGLDIRIKWPNDLLVGSRKLVGILTELNAEVDQVKVLVIGIGVNVTAVRKDLPDGATSLKLESRKDLSLVGVTQEMLRSLESYYFMMSAEGFAGIFKRWRELSAVLGEKVVIADSSRRWDGLAVDLAEDGGILIQDASGKVKKYMSGDISILKK